MAKTPRRTGRSCGDACDGITTEELERGIVQDMQRVIGQVAPLLAEKKDALQQLVRPGTATVPKSA